MLLLITAQFRDWYDSRLTNWLRSFVDWVLSQISILCLTGKSPKKLWRSSSSLWVESIRVAIKPTTMGTIDSERHSKDFCLIFGFNSDSLSKVMISHSNKFRARCLNDSCSWKFILGAYLHQNSESPCFFLGEDGSESRFVLGRAQWWTRCFLTNPTLHW